MQLQSMIKICLADQYVKKNASHMVLIHLNIFFVVVKGNTCIIINEIASLRLSEHYQKGDNSRYFLTFKSIMLCIMNAAVEHLVFYVFLPNIYQEFCDYKVTKHVALILLNIYKIIFPLSLKKHS